MNSIADTRPSDATASFDDSPRRFRLEDPGDHAPTAVAPRELSQAVAAGLSGSADEDLAPWVALPDGGLEWRPW